MAPSWCLLWREGTVSLYGRRDGRAKKRTQHDTSFIRASIYLWGQSLLASLPPWGLHHLTCLHWGFKFQHEFCRGHKPSHHGSDLSKKQDLFWQMSFHTSSVRTWSHAQMSSHISLVRTGPHPQQMSSHIWLVGTWPHPFTNPATGRGSRDLLICLDQSIFALGFCREGSTPEQS